jgi:hypothetical protein
MVPPMAEKKPKNVSGDPGCAESDAPERKHR